MLNKSAILKKVIVLAMVAYISPTFAAMIFGAWAFKYVCGLGKSDL